MEIGRVVTPSQTVGPFFGLGLDFLAVADLTTPGIVGQVICLQGTVFDGEGQPVSDALIETWQADAVGRYPETADVEAATIPTAFRGFGRVATDHQGHFRLRTIKPGRVPGPRGTLQAPHLVVAIFMRGLLKQLVTRVYFADDTAIETDPVLNMVDPMRRATLIAVSGPEADGAFRWDVRLQGPDETVFFEI